MKSMSGEVTVATIPTELGVFVARYSNRGLAGLDFPADTQPAAPAGKLTNEIAGWHRLATSALRCVLQGKPVGELPPFDLTGATEFQRRVWMVLGRIHLGKTMTYAEVAQGAGRPGAARAAGGACGANRIPVLIPCHRVLAANRRIGGFSGGLNWKRKLLALEGVEVAV